MKIQYVCELCEDVYPTERSARECEEKGSNDIYPIGMIYFDEDNKRNLMVCGIVGKYHLNHDTAYQVVLVSYISDGSIVERGTKLTRCPDGKGGLADDWDDCRTWASRLQALSADTRSKLFIRVVEIMKMRGIREFLVLDKEELYSMKDNGELEKTGFKRSLRR